MRYELFSSSDITPLKINTIGFATNPLFPHNIPRMLAWRNGLQIFYLTYLYPSFLINVIYFPARLITLGNTGKIQRIK